MAKLGLSRVIGLLLILPGCSKVLPARFHADHAWVRLPALPGRPGAGYFTIHGGRVPERLVAVSSTQVRSIELHESMATGAGMTGMRPIDGADVPPRGRLVFGPDGRHAMLFDVAPAVHPGGTLDLHFSFADGLTLDAKAKVVAAGDPPPRGDAAR